MKITKKQLRIIIKEEIGALKKQDDPVNPIMDDWEEIVNKYNLGPDEVISVLDELKDRWETMLADQENTDREDGYI